MKINIDRLGKHIMYFFLAFLYLSPQIIDTWPVFAAVSALMRYGRLLVGVGILMVELLIGIRSGKTKLGQAYLMMLIMQIWILFACVINSGMSVAINHLFTTISILSYCIVVKMAYKKKEEDCFLQATSTYCMLICMLNFVSQMAFGERGLYYDDRISWQAFYVCGNDNLFVFFYLFSAAMVIINELRRNKLSLKSYLFCLMLVVSMAISKSSTGFMILIALQIFLIVSIKKIQKWIFRHASKLLIVAVIIVVWFVAFGGWNTQFVRDIIFAVTQEDITLVARGLIWSNAMERILQSPILGHGTEIVNFAYTSLEGARSAHNMYLQLAYYGGFVSLILLISMIGSVFAKVRKRRDTTMVYSIALLALYLCAFIFEQNPFYLGFYALIMVIDSSGKKSMMIPR